MFWLVVWNIFYFSIYIYLLGISSSQLTFIFFREVGIPPTSILIPYLNCTKYGGNEHEHKSQRFCFWIPWVKWHGGNGSASSVSAARVRSRSDQSMQKLVGCNWYICLGHFRIDRTCTVLHFKRSSLKFEYCWFWIFQNGICFKMIL